MVRPKGRLLLYLRQKRRMPEPNDYRCPTQREVEDTAGIPERRLSFYENDKRPYLAPLDHMIALASYYEMPVRELIEPESLDQCKTLTKFLLTTLDFTDEELARCQT